MYKKSSHGYIIRQADSAYVPLTPENRDYQEYLSWIDAGNTPEPADPPVDGVPAFLPGAEPEES